MQVERVQVQTPVGNVQGGGEPGDFEVGRAGAGHTRQRVGKRSGVSGEAGGAEGAQAAGGDRAGGGVRDPAGEVGTVDHDVGKDVGGEGRGGGEVDPGVAAAGEAEAAGRGHEVEHRARRGGEAAEGEVEGVDVGAAGCEREGR